MLTCHRFTNHPRLMSGVIWGIFQEARGRFGDRIGRILDDLGLGEEPFREIFESFQTSGVLGIPERWRRKRDLVLALYARLFLAVVDDLEGPLADFWHEGHPAFHDGERLAQAMGAISAGRLGLLRDRVRAYHEQPELAELWYPLYGILTALRVEIERLNSGLLKMMSMAVH